MWISSTHIYRCSQPQKCFAQNPLDEDIHFRQGLRCTNYFFLAGRLRGAWGGTFKAERRRYIKMQLQTFVGNCHI